MSYSQINLNKDIILSWAYPQTGEIIVSNYNNVISNNDANTITLPSSLVVTTGTTLLFNNVGFNDFIILNNEGVPVTTAMTPGEINLLYLTDISTAGGIWDVIPFGGGTNGIVTFSTESVNNALSITNSTVTPPTGNIIFQIADSLNNLNNLTSQVNSGFLMVNDTTPSLTFNTYSLIGGLNIGILNSNGQGGAPIISLMQSLTQLASIEVGTLSLTLNSIATLNDNDDINLTTTGTGSVFLNQVEIDSNSNISNVNSLEVKGAIINPSVAQAQCFFFDNNTPPNNIVIENQFNIASVTGGNGSYVITFATPFNNGNYTVLLSLARGTEVIAPFQVFFRSKTATQLMVFTVDTLGNLLPALDGVSVAIFNNSN
jgi:hypothetical protein